MVSRTNLRAVENRVAAGDGLGPRLRECGAEELMQLLEENLDRLTPSHVRQALRNAYASPEAVAVMMKATRLLSVYEVRRELARHPQTPEIHAVRFAGGLYWRDLAQIAADARARPRVRRAAEVQLVQRLPSLAVGEKISLARIAAAGVIQELRKDPHPRVLLALLENPRLTEGHVLPLASSSASSPEILAQLAKNGRWGSRYSVRSALARNRATPLPTALHLLPGLKKVDLAAVAGDRALAKPVRDRAGLLLGRAPT